MSQHDLALERIRTPAERQALDPQTFLARRAKHRADLREAARVLIDQPPLPPDEQAWTDQRRAEIRAMVRAELARRSGHH